MIPNIYTYDGHAINDTTNYQAFFEGKANSFFRQADGPTKELKRADNTPVAASIDMESKTLTLVIMPRGTFHSQMDELNKWFNTHDKTLKTLVIKNTADSDRQWYVRCRPERISYARPDAFVVILKVPDPIWRTVADNTETWNVTASGQTNVFTALGNRDAYPVITLKGGAAKSGGFSERIFRAWYNPIAYAIDNLPLDVTDNAWNTAALVNDTTVSNQINQGGGITDAETSIPVDTAVGDGLPATGGVCYCGTEQIKYDDITTGVMTVSTNGRGWGGTTAAAHADNAVMAKSHILANGADVQVYVGKRKVPRWLSGMNTTTSQVWIAANMDAGQAMVLKTAIASSGAITEIEVKMTTAAAQALAALEKKGVFLLLIDSEVFTCTGVDRLYYKITGVTRAMMSSSMGAHTVGDNIYFVDDEIWVCWGDLSAVGTDDDVTSSSGAIVQDETHQPMIDMDNSTNVSWRFLTFWDNDGLRAGGWKREVAAGRSCKVLGGSHWTAADPATEIGMLGQVYELGGVPRANTYDLRATLYHPAGFTSITCNGAKYRYTIDFPKVAGLWVGDSEQLMASVFNLTAPSALKTWVAWTETAVALGTKKYISFRCAGNVKAVDDNKHGFEVQTITTLAIASASVPQLGFSGAAQSVYEFGRTASGTPARLENLTSGDYLEILFLGEIDETLEIDCDAEKSTYLANNTRVDRAINYPARDYMISLPAGNSTWRWRDAGTAGVTIILTWKDRNT